MELYDVIAVIISFSIGLIAGKVYYGKFKDALHSLRECITAIDNAFADDSISKEEVKEIYEKCIQPIRKMK